MRSIFLFLYLSFSTSLFYAGFAPDTLVLGRQGFMPIGQVQKGFYVASYELTKKVFFQAAVTNYYRAMTSYACRIACDNDISFVASPHQLVLISGEWRLIRDLKNGDRLMCYDGNYAVVTSVEMCNNEEFLCEITVDPFHTFCVTPRGIVVHNNEFIAAGGSAFLGTLTATAIAAPPLIPVIAVIKGVAVVSILGVALWRSFKKKKNAKNDHNTREVSGGCSSPSPKKPNDEDEFRRKHPHGRYEDVGYHHKNSGGIKSPAPIDGQKALDHSLRIKDTRPHRIGISEDQFVVLRETSPGLFHGYVCEWEQLTDTMQKVLRKAQWVYHSGKIICK